MALTKWQIISPDQIQTWQEGISQHQLTKFNFFIKYCLHCSFIGEVKLQTEFDPDASGTPHQDFRLNVYCAYFETETAKCKQLLHSLKERRG